jgi:RNA polymerase sigma-70 factor, ECF subfamily
MLPFSIAAAVPNVGKESAARMDEDTFRLFYERTARPLRGYLIRMLNDRAAVDDLLQESYLRLLKATLPDEASDEHLKNYLFRIATNLIKDQKARRKETELSEDTEPAGAPPADGDVTSVLAGLKPVQRELLWLAYVERFSHFEIAHMLSLKPQSIRPLLSRARHAFAGALKRGGFEAQGTRMRTTDHPRNSLK